MNQDFKEQAKARIDEALKQTQTQTEQVASELGGFLRAGVQKLREAIQRDINSRQP